MKKIVILSTNSNPDYYLYAPYQERAWNRLGWEVAIMVTPDFDPLEMKLQNPDTYICQLPMIEGVRSETIAQAGRLYAHKYLDPEAMLMTCDMDLIPLSNYWSPTNLMTVYGHDLTWFNYYPMGYIAMMGKQWAKVMKGEGTVAQMMEADFKETKIAYSQQWEEWWNVDWNLVTKRMKPFKNDITFINRGQIDIAGATLAKGRIDRYNWEETQQQPEPFIDAHCENNNTRHPDKFGKFLNVFEKYYGKL